MGNKLMVKLFIGSEAIFFVSLIMAYLYFWRSGNFQQASSQFLHIKTTGLFTLLLIGSSFTFMAAEYGFKKGRNNQVRIWLVVTIVLGLVFLAGQGHEYYDLIQKNVTINKSEFGTSFYTLTGFHGLHVLLGLIVLGIVLLLSWTGQVNKRSNLLGTVGLYWHFVDAVWIVVFTVIYVLPYIL